MKHLHKLNTAEGKKAFDEGYEAYLKRLAEKHGQAVADAARARGPAMFKEKEELTLGDGTNGRPVRISHIGRQKFVLRPLGWNPVGVLERQQVVWLKSVQFYVSQVGTRNITVHVMSLTEPDEKKAEVAAVPDTQRAVDLEQLRADNAELNALIGKREAGEELTHEDLEKIRKTLSESPLPTNAPHLYLYPEGASPEDIFGDIAAGADVTEQDLEAPKPETGDDHG